MFCFCFIQFAVRCGGVIEFGKVELQVQAGKKKKRKKKQQERREDNKEGEKKKN